jgi:hypothetical protein
MRLLPRHLRGKALQVRRERIAGRRSLDSRCHGSPGALPGSVEPVAKLPALAAAVGGLHLPPRPASAGPMLAPDAALRWRRGAGAWSATHWDKACQSLLTLLWISAQDHKKRTREE